MANIFEDKVPLRFRATRVSATAHFAATIAGMASFLFCCFAAAYYVTQCLAYTGSDSNPFWWCAVFFCECTVAAFGATVLFGSKWLRRDRITYRWLTIYAILGILQVSVATGIILTAVGVPQNALVGISKMFASRPANPQPLDSKTTEEQDKSETPDEAKQPSVASPQRPVDEAKSATKPLAASGEKATAANPSKTALVLTVPRGPFAVHFHKDKAPKFVVIGTDLLICPDAEVSADFKKAVALDEKELSIPSRCARINSKLETESTDMDFTSISECKAALFDVKASDLKEALEALKQSKTGFVVTLNAKFKQESPEQLSLKNLEGVIRTLGNNASAYFFKATPDIAANFQSEFGFEIAEYYGKCFEDKNAFKALLVEKYKAADSKSKDVEEIVKNHREAKCCKDLSEILQCRRFDLYETGKNLVMHANPVQLVEALSDLAETKDPLLGGVYQKRLAVLKDMIKAHNDKHKESFRAKVLSFALKEYNL